MGLESVAGGMFTMKKIGVVLSGLGVYDGAEIGPF